MMEVEYPWKTEEIMDEWTKLTTWVMSGWLEMRLVRSSVIESMRCLHPTLLQETEEIKFLEKFQKHVITKQTGKKSVPWLKNSQNLSQSWDVFAKNLKENHFFQLVPSCWSFLYDFMRPFFGWGIFAKSRVCLRWSRSTSWRKWGGGICTSKAVGAETKALHDYR